MDFNALAEKVKNFFNLTPFLVPQDQEIGRAHV